MELDEFIGEVERAAPEGEPLARLTAATLRAEELTHLADELVDHFVASARESGCSWAQIGDTLGVTKQAAQQRHAPEKSGLRGWFRGRNRPRLFTRFTYRARTAIEQAQQEARDMKHDWVGTEHILLGLLADPDSVASKVLGESSIDGEIVRAEIEERIGEGDEPVIGHIAFTPRSKKTLELTLREAVTLGHDYIGTEHILLALLRAEGLAAQILNDRGVNLHDTRMRIIEMLSGTSR